MSYTFHNLIYIWFKFHFQHYHFSFLCCSFIFTGQFSLLITNFGKMACKFIMEDNAATQLHALLSAHWGLWLHQTSQWFSGPVTDSCKSSTWQVSQGKLPSPCQTWGSASTAVSKQSCSQGLQLPGSHALVHICIPSPGIFTPRSLCLRPWVEVLFRASAEVSSWGWRAGGTLKTLSDRVFATLSLPDLPPFSLSPWVHRTVGASCLGFSQQWDDLCLCWATWLSSGESGTGKVSLL